MRPKSFSSLGRTKTSRSIVAYGGRKSFSRETPPPFTTKSNAPPARVRVKPSRGSDDETRTPMSAPPRCACTWPVRIETRLQFDDAATARRVERPTFCRRTYRPSSVESSWRQAAARLARRSSSRLQTPPSLKPTAPLRSHTTAIVYTRRSCNTRRLRSRRGHLKSSDCEARDFRRRRSPPSLSSRSLHTLSRANGSTIVELSIVSTLLVEAPTGGLVRSNDSIATIVVVVVVVIVDRSAAVARSAAGESTACGSSHMAPRQPS